MQIGGLQIIVLLASTRKAIIVEYARHLHGIMNTSTPVVFSGMTFFEPVVDFLD
jgi:hypothetical protein